MAAWSPVRVGPASPPSGVASTRRGQAVHAADLHHQILQIRGRHAGDSPCLGKAGRPDPSQLLAGFQRECRKGREGRIFGDGEIGLLAEPSGPFRFPAYVPLVFGVDLNRGQNIGVEVGRLAARRNKQSLSVHAGAPQELPGSFGVLDRLTAGSIEHGIGRFR